MDYYSVLGVAPTASTEEIERAFRALARKVHPDLNGADAARSTARMKQLNEIRETLTDPLLRTGYDDRLRQERQGPRVTEPPARPAPPPEAPRPAPEARRRPFGEGYQPHPHVAPFLRTHVEQPVPARPVRRDLSPIVLLLAVAAVLGAVVLLWPRELSAPLPVVASPAKPHPAKREGVVVVRGDTGNLRRAVRKTAKVVPVGASFDEVINKFGPPDRSEPGATTADLALIYGQVRVEIHDGLVVGGSP